MADIKIHVMKNGPLKVEGAFELIDSDGNSIPILKPALCRCGASTQKPFCDGSHSRTGFDASAKIVPESKE